MTTPTREQTDVELARLYNEVEALKRENVKIRTELREISADSARWLTLNRATPLRPWLRAVLASVVRRTARQAMAHDAALPRIPEAH